MRDGRARAAASAVASEAVDERRFLLQGLDPQPLAPLAVSPPAPATPLAIPSKPAALDRLRARLPTWHAGHLGAALAEESGRGTAFLLMPVLMGIGVFLYFTAPVEPAWPLLVLAVATLAAVARAVRARPTLLAACAAVLLVLAGVVAGKVETWRAGTRLLGSEVTTLVTGRVLAVERLASGRTRLTLAVTATERPVLRSMPSRLRVSARRLPPGIQAGSLVQGLARVRPPAGPVEPGAYDFSFGAYFDGLGGSGFFIKDPVLLADDGPPSSFLARLSARASSARDRLADRIRSRIGGPEGEIAAALLIGVRAGIPEPVNEALRRTGLAHVLSISGLHMALVAATVMGTLRVGMALVPGVASRWPVKKLAAGMALAATALYLAVSGIAVAAERSFVMLAVMLVAVMADRAALTMRNLAIATLIILARAPHEAMGPSFQMSFAATAALIGAYGIWAERFGARGDRPKAVAASLARRTAGALVRHAGGLALTTLIAGTATTIFAVHHFERVAPLSLPANLVAMPIVSTVVMPAAVTALVAMPFGLDGMPLAVMGKGLSAMLAVAGWFSDHTPLDAAGPAPAGAVALFTAALVAATVFAGRLRLLAVPLVAAALAWLAMRATPDILVTEDARLVAFRLDDGRLAVNRSRPAAFALESWQRTFLASGVARPRLEKPRDQGKSRAAAARQLAEPSDGSFACGDGLCLGRHPSGAVVAHAELLGAARPACGRATLLIVADATPAAAAICAGTATHVITLRDLARRGSAAVQIVPGKPPSLAVSFALAEPYRPWHRHRAFSRAARGLSEPSRRPAPSSAGSAPPADPGP